MIKPRVYMSKKQIMEVIDRAENFGTHSGMMFSGISKEDLLKKIEHSDRVQLCDYMGFAESGSDSGIGIVVSGNWQSLGVKMPFTQDEIRRIVNAVMDEVPDVNLFSLELDAVQEGSQND